VPTAEKELPHDGKKKWETRTWGKKFKPGEKRIVKIPKRKLVHGVCREGRELPKGLEKQPRKKKRRLCIYWGS